PRLFHFRDRRHKVGFVLGSQTIAKRADINRWAFGIVVRRDINLDVSGGGNGLPSGHCTPEESDGEKGREIADHFGLTSRKLKHRFSGRKWQIISRTQAASAFIREI